MSRNVKKGRQVLDAIFDVGSDEMAAEVGSLVGLRPDIADDAHRSEYS